jgi:nitrate reductase beta subunit
MADPVDGSSAGVLGRRGGGFVDDLTGAALRLRRAVRGQQVLVARRELFTAGDVAPVDHVLRKLAAMRSYMRDINLGRDPDGSIPAAVGMTEEDMYDMYRLLALAKYDERYVIPAAHSEQAHALEELATECALDYEGGPGMGGSGPFGEGSGAPTPIAVENFQMLKDRQTSDTVAAPDDKDARVNLLNWDGKGTPDGLFPPRSDEPR